MSNPFAIKSASPRVRLAARLYATGVAPTKKAASTMAGLHPNYLTLLTPNSAKGSEVVKRIVSNMDQRIEDESVSTSTLIQELGRKALGKLHQLMSESSNEHVALKAAVDLADRSPATAKTQKVQVDSLTLSGEDAKELALALVQSAAERERYKHIGVDGLVEIPEQKAIGE